MNTYFKNKYGTIESRDKSRGFKMESSSAKKVLNRQLEVLLYIVAIQMLTDLQKF